MGRRRSSVPRHEDVPEVDAADVTDLAEVRGGDSAGAAPSAAASAPDAALGRDTATRAGVLSPRLGSAHARGGPAAPIARVGRRGASQAAASREERAMRRAAKAAARAASQASAGSAADSVCSQSASDDAPRPCVWVVEDVAVARRSVARALRAWGFAVAEMEDGRRAMDALQALVRSSAAPEAGTVGSPVVAAATSASSAGSLGGTARWPDAVLLDSRMPELDGEGVLRELRELAASLASSGEAAMAARVRAIPVLGATGSTDAVEQGSLLRGGALAILVKPIDPVELALALEREARIVLPPGARAVAHRRGGGGWP